MTEVGLPERIDRYRVVRELGRGGMGVVVLAERDDGEFRQKVAIKLLASGPGRGDRLEARLRAERQILAALDHPGIAKLLDGGALSDGSPFLVMEYVEGERIDRWCDERGLDARARVRLLIKACEAVDAAHRRLIVHRDLKPGNVLVTTDGEVKLLDFGIAKLLDPAAVDWTLAPTELGVAPLTLAYASPEQITGQPIGTASDVYSLGVLAYELLAGRSPWAARSLPELARVICEDDPPTPSAAATLPELEATLDGWAPSRQGKRAGTPRRVALAGLDRDLDAITLRALRKEPALRYPSAAALAADLQRYLDGRPVEARQGNLAYRASKFVRRNRWAVAVGAAAAVTLTAFVWRLGIELARSERERDKARRVQELLIDAFEASDPTTARSGVVTARDVLERATPRLVAELSDQPLILAPLLVSTGRIHLRMGLYEPAEEALERALGIVRELDSSEPADLRAALAALAELRSRQARYDDALALLDEALGDDGAGAGERAALLAAKGENLRRLGRFDPARAALESVLELRRALAPDGSVEIAESHRALALLADEAGDDARAEAEARIALAELRRLGAPPARVAEAAQDLATVINDPSRSDEMEALNREALALERRAFGERHPKVAETLNNLAVIAHYRNDHGEAASLLGEALGIQIEALGETHPDVASMRLNLATFELAAGRPAVALATVDEVLGALQRFPDAQPLRLAAALRVRATASWLLGDLDAAVADIERSLEAASTLPAEHPFLLATRARRAGFRRDLATTDDVEAELSELVTRQREKLPGQHRDRVAALAELAALRLESGRLDEAEPLAEEAAAIAAATLDPNGPEAAWARAVAARVRLARGDEAAGRDELAAARLALAASLAPGHPRLRRLDAPR